MQRLPPFKSFLNYAAGHTDELKYDVGMFSSDRLKEPPNPFSKEEYIILGDTISAMVFAYLAQYHQWIAEQIGGEDEQRSDHERR